MNNNLLTPSIGSNQFVTKFIPDRPKRKFKIKIKFATKVKIFVVILLTISLYLNYYIIKDNYLLTCDSPTFDGIKQDWGHWGHAMKKSTCEEIQNMKIRTINQQ